MNCRSTVLQLSNLRVDLEAGANIVEEIDLEIGFGEIVGLVGESGSGKTTTALSIFGYTRPGTEIRSVGLVLKDESLETRDEIAQARGRLASYVPQDPSTALNPSMRVAGAIDDMIDAHRGNGEGRSAIPGILASLDLPATDAFGRRFPHELSGGQQQRVCIAAALACGPALVVLDEPTTGLDVVTQAQILQELLRLRDEQGVSMLYVTHDLAVVAQIADRIAVMYAGRIVEQGPRDRVLRRPRHPYTRGLIESIPDHLDPRQLKPMPGIAVGVGDRPRGCPFAPRCPQRVERCTHSMPDPEMIGEGQSVRCFEWTRTPTLELTPRLLRGELSHDKSTPILEVQDLHAEHHTQAETVIAAKNVSLKVASGSCLALVGESGSGKTTIGRTIAGLHAPTRGDILLSGERLAALARSRSVEQRRKIQIVFQNPLDALNPRHTVGSAIARTAQFLRGLSRIEARKEVRQLLEHVRLPTRIAEQYPAELSGGERQRVAIARALAARPQVIVCDEITSALDVSVQAAVLELLTKLRAEMQLSLLFISHDLGVVASVADSVAVLEHGAICEEGPTKRILDRPQHPYTQRLMSAAPSLTAVMDSRKATERPAPMNGASSGRTDRRTG